ncbi:MAG TPA: SRPBCC family protein [Marmoricola sp.]|nr:SRPBCC family protein [Marmoricola sp.]
MHDTVVVRLTIDAEPARVWAVLADGWLYPSWVVGASRMREVDASWPAPGSQLHHSVGLWPLLLNDRTEVIGSVPQEELRLRAHGWPVGAAEVLIRLTPADGGTEVTMEEDAVEGPARLVPHQVRQLGVLPRNRESLRRLAFLAEGRAA